MIKILIVDDHGLVRAGIKRMLNDCPGMRVIAEASSGEEAIQCYKLERPDVILMDIRMPGIGGLEATRKLLRYDPEIKILAVTVCDDDIFPTKLLQAGAYGYLTKGATLEEMVKAIKAVSSRQRYISPQIANQLAIMHLNKSGSTPFESLSERELQISMMITNGYKVQDIASKLCLSPKTVNSYRYRIFEKMTIKNDVELTHLAVKHGLLEDLMD